MSETIETIPAIVERSQRLDRRLRPRYRVWACPGATADECNATAQLWRAGDYTGTPWYGGGIDCFRLDVEAKSVQRELEGLPGLPPKRKDAGS